MDKDFLQLILASQSPRRKELLHSLFVPFISIAADLKEETIKKAPEDIVVDLAAQKARAVFRHQTKPSLVLGADTIVEIGGRILGKPSTREQASNMLQLLSGQQHNVYTGVCLVSEGAHTSFWCKTSVSFREIEPDHLELYLDSGESMDKAGSYGIQGLALGFIADIQGSYSNVVGLPVDMVQLKLQEHLALIGRKSKNWREIFV